MRTAGLVLDFYDDSGRLLPSLVTHDTVPDFVKQAEELTPERLGRMPNEMFALVAIDGDQVLRKYAVSDPGNTWLSTRYFLSQRGLLPKLAQAQAAQRLLQAHFVHEMRTPTDLVKTCFHLDSDPEIEGQLVKGASLVDITGQRAPATLVKEAVDEDQLILGKFPIRDQVEVKQAAHFFDENVRLLHPSHRREFATKLAARAQELAVPLEGVVLKYASTQLEPTAAGLILQRKQYIPKETGALLDKFASAVGTEDPLEMAHALCEFDERTGLSHLWDRHVADPYYTMLGTVKEAQPEEFVWTMAAERATESDLRRLSESFTLLEQTYGAEFANDFRKDPVGVFKSMPDPMKIELARMASETLPRGAN